ncbi:MAG: hypothetical protein IPN20_10885 [Haliscomenobacter sp.]|nr:hypothetical protein [Haliscomenobacter sp.]
MNKLAAFFPIVFLLGLGSWLRAPLGSVLERFVALPENDAERSALAVNFTCVDTVHVSLDDACRFLCSPEMVLKGTFTDCASPSDFSVVVDDSNPSNGPQIDGPGVFKYTVLLSNPSACTSFSPCWGVVIAEDKTPPVITPPADLTLDSFCHAREVFLNQPKSLEIAGKALVKDNCAERTDTLTRFRDEIAYDNNCDSLVIRRIFTAFDRFGNKADGVQRITLVRPTLSEIRVNPKIELDAGCDQNRRFKLDAAGNVSPEVTGYPYVINDLGDTTFLTPGGACGFSADYIDQRFSICEDAYKIIRRWKMLDWCTGQVRTLEQLIKIGDIVPPVVSCPQVKGDTLRASTSPFDCRAALEIPAPQVSDACSPYAWSAEIWQDTLRWTLTPGGLAQVMDSVLLAVTPFSAQSRIVTGIPAGCHRIKYKVRDDCDNEANINCVVCVEDKISPVAICDDSLQVSLDRSGYAFLYAKEVDEGSKDNCSLVRLEIRRATDSDSLSCTPKTPGFSPWGDLVVFSCCDIGKSVTVELRATDAAGNTNVCWSKVVVEDKIAPACYPPKDTAVSCRDLPFAVNLSDSASLARYFGVPEVADNCEAYFEALPADIQLDHCGVGTIIRKFRALDRSGNSSSGLCEQRITVLPAYNYTIKFPEDFEDHCAEPRPDSIVTDELGCDNLVVSVRDKRYESDGEACYKIFRTYDVINWCEYDGISDPIIVPRDADCNGIPGDKDVWVIVRPNETTYYDTDADEQNQNPAAGVKGSSCDGLTNPQGYWKNSGMDPSIRSRGYWQYTQVIEVFDDIPPQVLTEKEITVCADRPDCTSEFFLSVGVREVCSPQVEITTRIKEAITEYYNYSETDWELYGRFPKYLFSGILPVGEYVIEIKVIDDCKNVATSDVRVRIVDCNDPSPICYHGLSTQLMPVPEGMDVDGDSLPDKGAATVWVGDVVKSAIETCSNPVRYSINREGEPADITKTSLVLTCKDLGYLPVEVHAWDNAYNPHAPQPDGTLGGPNHSFCKTYILVQDDQFRLCDTSSSASADFPLSGVVTSALGKPLPGVYLTLSGAKVANTLTNGEGAFALPGLKHGYDYSVTPSRAEPAGSGVTTFDLLLVTQHILGNKKLASPYQLLAADVNLSGSLTTQDLIQMRKVILGVDRNFAHGRSWRFVPADYVFSNPNSPWKPAFPEVINFNDLEGPVSDADFIAVKLGDVNGSAPAFKGNGPGLEQRAAAKPALLRLQDRMLTPGEDVLVPVYLGDPERTKGLQFTLQADPQLVEITGLEYGLASQNHLFWTEEHPETLNLSWDAGYSNAPDLHDGSVPPLLVLKLRAVQAVPLSRALRLDQRGLSPEAYLESLSGYDTEPLALDYRSSLAGRFVLLPPVPNPAGAYTTVQWMLPQEGEARLELRDSWGRVCAQLQKQFYAGSHTWTIERSQVPGPGLYIVTVRALGQWQSQKVLFIE